MGGPWLFWKEAADDRKKKACPAGPEYHTTRKDPTQKSPYLTLYRGKRVKSVLSYCFLGVQRTDSKTSSMLDKGSTTTQPFPVFMCNLAE